MSGACRRSVAVGVYRCCLGSASERSERGLRIHMHIDADIPGCTRERSLVPCPLRSQCQAKEVRGGLELLLSSRGCCWGSASAMGRVRGKGFNCLVFERTGTVLLAPALGLDADYFSFCKTQLDCFWQSQTGARLDFSIQ